MLTIYRKSRCKWGRMFVGRVSLCVIVMTVFWSLSEAQITVKWASACYGNINNYLRLDCLEREYINVTKIKHAAKNKTSNCISPASVETYRKECCTPGPNDCSQIVADSLKVKCDGSFMCRADATWSNMVGTCDELDFPKESTYMVIEYVCIDRDMVTKFPPSQVNFDRSFVLSTTKSLSADKNSSISSTENVTSTITTTTRTSITSSLRPTSTAVTTATTAAASTSSTIKTSQLTASATTQTQGKLSDTTTSTTIRATIKVSSTAGMTLTTEASRSTYGNSGNNGISAINSSSTLNETGSMSNGNGAGSSNGSTQRHTADKKADELSDAMVGAIVGGSLGMLLTFVVFIFYWGRKRHLRIVGKHQTTVWDYLLSQTFTVRGTRGYDHFSSIRSSASSDGETSSPTIRKNMWLPNIVHKDNTQPDDAISNYENDPDSTHRVEIHPHAEPTPYAFLNLYIDPANLSHHEA